MDNALDYLRQKEGDEHAPLQVCPPGMLCLGKLD